MSPILKAGLATMCVLFAAIGAYLVFSPPTPEGPKTPAADQPMPLARGLDAAKARCVAISPDGGTVAGGDGGVIRIWGVASGKELAALEAGYHVFSLAFSPDGAKLAAAMEYNNVKVWDVNTQHSTTLLDNPKPKVQSILIFASPMVVFSPDGKQLAAGGGCIHEIRVWDLPTGKEAATLEGHDEYGVRALVFAPDGKSLASVGADGAFKIWDLATGKESASWQIANRSPAAVFSADCKTLAVVHSVEKEADGKTETEYTVKLWDVATRKEKAAMPIDWATEITFSPDGRTFACGDEKGTVKLWDVRQGKELATISAHTDAVSSLAFSADGNVLVSCGKDQAVKVHDVAKAK